MLMAMFGIGGGAFVVPAIDLAFFSVPSLAHPPFQVIVMGSLLAIWIGAMPRAFALLRQTNLQRKISFQLILSAIPFIALLSVVSSHLNEYVLRYGFALLILLVGLWTIGSLFIDRLQSTDQNSLQTCSSKKIIMIGAIGGGSSALFGLGGATLLTPLLSNWAVLSMNHCVNISIVFVAITSFISLMTLTFSWVQVHGIGDIEIYGVILIGILGISAAITQRFAGKAVTQMSDSKRKTTLGIYLLALSGWTFFRASQL